MYRILSVAHRGHLCRGSRRSLRDVRLAGKLRSPGSFLLRPFSISSPRRLSGDEVRIIEVGPRDGLQNIKQSISTSVKVELIQRLAASGLRNIEATSFVPPKWVPQLADGAQIMSQISPLIQRGDIRFQVLTPNARGFENAVKSNAREVVVFASATEAFSQKNQNSTVAEALEKAKAVVEAARSQNIAVRGCGSLLLL